jgi:hypothetical protein
MAGLGKIFPGVPYTYFNIPMLRDMATTGKTGRIRDGVAEVEGIQASLEPGGPGYRAYFICHRCGGVEMVLPKEGRQKNPCPARDADPEIYLILRKPNAEPRQLGVLGW